MTRWIIGIPGGIGPESTVEYYRLIQAGYRQRDPDGSYPSIRINSITGHLRRETVSRLIRIVEAACRAARAQA